MKINKKAFSFFNNLEGTLDIKLSEETESIGGLLNQKATPEAKITKMSLSLIVRPEDDDDDNRSLTKDELNMIVFYDVDLIMLNGQDYHSDTMTSVRHFIEHEANKSRTFTIKDLIKCVLKTEKKTRKDTEWFGGIDVHHIYFEGITKSKGNKFNICWDS